MKQWKKSVSRNSGEEWKGYRKYDRKRSMGYISVSRNTLRLLGKLGLTDDTIGRCCDVGERKALVIYY